MGRPATSEGRDVVRKEMTDRMSASDVLNPDGPRLQGFLYATIGQDSRGADVTLLSALARLGLDPWDEAEGLTALGRSAAVARIEGWLARAFDVVTLAGDRAAMAARLAALLPGPRVSGVGAALSGGIGGGQSFSPILLLAVLIALALVLPLLLGTDGGGGP
jgi:hypothetical protein